MLVRRIASEEISALPSQAEIDPAGFFQMLVLKTALEIFVGKGSAGHEELADTFLNLNRHVGKRMRSPVQIPLSVPLPANLRILRLEKKLTQKLKQI